MTRCFNRLQPREAERLLRGLLLVLVLVLKLGLLRFDGHGLRKRIEPPNQSITQTKSRR
jgi:hypothetical protein